MKLTFLKPLAFIGLIALSFTACTSSENWQSVNEKLLQKYKLTAYETDFLTETGIKPSPEVGKVSPLDALPETELYPGIKAKIFWNSQALSTVLTLEPNATIPAEALPADRFLIVLKGEIEQSIDDKTSRMKAVEREEPDGTHGGTPITELIYQPKGTMSSVKAGENGAKLMEVYGAVRIDYLKKLGITNLPEHVDPSTATIKASVQPNVVYNLFDLPFTQLSEHIFSRIISGEKIQLGFTSMDPLAEIEAKVVPTEMLELATRGKGSVTMLEETQSFTEGDLAYFPTNLVTSFTVDSLGLDLIEVLSSGRAGISEIASNARAAFQEIIPEGTKPELLIDGSKSKPTLIFTEGPKWMNGKVYFSNMFFDQAFGASPQKSSTVEMDVNGKYRNITQGKMQTNGLYPYKNGNLIVCDMMGHRVVEMTTKGKVIKVLADRYDGKPIDGPNDVVTDAKGGFYFTDPQFTMEPEKFQPGRAVYYVSPEGDVKRVTEPNEFAMPNGILLSPDGKTLFINNCYDDEDWFPVKSEKDNFIWAYDVNDDGSIRNGRKFAKLLLPTNVLDRKGKSSSADGMAMDTDGNIYVATYLGVQIFDAKGSFIGLINLPTFPVSLCFGGDDMKTLFIVSFDKVYKLPTKKTGYINYL